MSPILTHSVSVDNTIIFEKDRNYSPKSFLTLNDDISYNELPLEGKPMRSNSVDYNNNSSVQSMRDVDDIRLDIDAPQIPRKYSLNDEKATNKTSPSPDKHNKPRMVINRKLYLGDRQFFRGDDIPKELQVYLLRACEEYELVKSSYKNWSYDTTEKLSRMNENERREFYNDPKVPELQVKIPLDDGESNRIEMDEW